MPRVAAPNRVAEIVDAALSVFGRRGFARAQMSEVAAEAGVSVGTLYNYVESKDALLLLCAVYAFDPDEAVGGALPLTVSSRQAFLTRLRRHIDLVAQVPALDAALAAKATPKDVAAECALIVTDLFDLIARTRRGMDALERSARDVPDIAQLFYGDVRLRLLDQFTDYIARRARQRKIAPVVDPAVTARFAVESVTWMARHRYGDADGGQMNFDDVRTSTIQLVTRAICGDNS
jgi:AcrR family transcriptional regulator